MLVKTKIRFLCLVFFSAAFMFTACDNPMGMGPIVDLEPPVLIVTNIALPDGTIHELLNESGKIFIGPGILFGNGASLQGRAFDNIGVAQIRVTETGTNNVWTSSVISQKNEDPQGWQDWSITLEGLTKGERAIEVTAYDRASLIGALANIGPETVKQLTLLVDTEPPIVEKIEIERQPGIFANLLPMALFNDKDKFDPDNFDYVDYFQNEKFSIRAVISHEFALSDVKLNFIDNETGVEIFSEPRKETGGTLYTPYWDITAADFTNVSSAYLKGKHYFKVVISARAQAGHENIRNELFNFCWYPESDKPRINIDGYKSDNDILTHTINTAFPMVVFDDDKLNTVSYKIITETVWNNYGGTDENKLQSAVNAGSFTTINQNLGRNVVIAVNVGGTGGLCRLVVTAQDTNAEGSHVTSNKAFKLNVINNNAEFCDLILITCDNADGAYSLDQELKFKLIFGGAITPASNATITIRGGANGNQGAAQTITLSYNAAEGNSVLTATWKVPANIIFDPVEIVSVNIANVRGAAQNTLANEGTNVRSNYNASRKGLKVMSVKPTVTLINGLTVSNNETVLAANGSRSQLKLTFSHAVYPENGTITVKPADGWLIPPVLTNDEFSKINSALTIEADQTALLNSANASYYVKTTHGLSKNTSNAYTGAPDISTKYVLNFTSGLDVASIRTILNKAKYNWQEIDVSTITASNGAGTSVITVDLDKLPDGRLWKVEIVGPASAVGAFRDEAGNTFDGWNAASVHTFWSQKAAEPVIRVNRVSNNSATINPTTNTNFNPSQPISLTNTTSRINVQYRIDCETPGAVITYGTNTSKVATITAAMTSTTIYKASGTDDGQNSSTADATAAELASTTFINPAANTSYTTGVTLAIGDTNLYTARKDYIAARATRSLLTQSNTGYEGAFKTLIVYRYISNSQVRNNEWLKFEATDTRNGAVTTAGFPMSLNDRSGKTSKYAFRNATSNTAYTVDWIWISWEMVCNFWHVGMSIPTNVPDSAFDNDAWEPFNDEWYSHIFRKYGNYGLKVRN